MRVPVPEKFTDLLLRGLFLPRLVPAGGSVAELIVGLYLSQPWAGPLAARGPQSQVGVGRPVCGVL